jgi:hypothetical protein
MPLSVLLLAWLTSAVPAQVSDSTGTIRGIVVDARDSTPIQTVSVRLQGGATTLTGEDGRFEITSVPAGTQELYVSVVDFILVKRTVIVVPGMVVDLMIPIAAGTGTYTESVTVRPASAPVSASTPVGQETLASHELQQLRGLITNDPFRAIQVLPGVAAGDDLRSEFTVRGNAIDHMNFTFEGVPAPFLVHTVQSINDSGSVAMVNGDILDDITLSSGSYPQRFGGRTGAELDFRMREGSRDGTRSHISVSLTDAAGVLEGPLGGQRKGSWLFSVRKSYLDQLLRRIDPENDFGFGFTDLQTKIAYDLNGRHQLQFAVAAGRSRLDLHPDVLEAGEVQDGRNATAIGVVTWRHLVSPRVVVTHKVSGATNTFRNTTKERVELDRGRATEVLYRVDWSYAPGGARQSMTFDGGGQVGRSMAARLDRELVRSNSQFFVLEEFSQGTHAGSLYAQTHFSAGRAGLTIGGRIDRWGLIAETSASPWIQTVWPISGSVNLRAGAGIHRQIPSVLHVSGLRGTPELGSERAYQLDVSIEGRLGSRTTLQVAGYNREDRDFIGLPDDELRVVGNAIIGPSATTRYRNSLDGYSRGLDLLVQRRSLNGLSGWIAYSLSHTRNRDRESGEIFWGDWDQRHTLNSYAAYRFNDRLSASTRFRYGSNFPAVGYWEQREGQYFVAERRNRLRVPPYSRLDVRGNRTFTWRENRLTLFVEVVNVYQRTNVRQAAAGINARTFQAFGLFDAMFPRYPSVGFLLEF